MAWKPGESGNRNGRGQGTKGQKIVHHLNDLIERSPQTVVEVASYLEKQPRLGAMTSGRLMAAKMILAAFEGQADMTKTVLERVEGKVSDGALAQMPAITIISNVAVSTALAESTPPYIVGHHTQGQLEAVSPLESVDNQSDN